MNVYLLILILVLLLLSISVVPAATTPEDDQASDRTDAYLKAEMEKRHIPGLALVVLRSGKPIKMKGYGFANVEWKQPVTLDTVFQIQSMTKQFVAMGVMMLVEEGKIRLEEKIGAYLPGSPETWNAITVRHLLSHTSGIKDFINEPTASLREEVTEESVFQATVPRPLNFPTGEKYAYSNTNYQMLGMIIQKVTGKTWGDFVQERILTPLDMTTTRLYTQKHIVARRASGYAWTGGSLKNGEFIAPSVLAYAGGGLLSTVEDLAKWDAALYTEKLVKKTTLKEIWTAGVLNDGKPAPFGFGWLVGESNGHRMVEHGGAHMTGFTSHILHYPDDHLTVIVLTNLSGGGPQALARNIANLYNPALYAVDALPAKSDPSQARLRRLQAFLQDVAHNTPDSQNMTPGLQADMDADDRTKIAVHLSNSTTLSFLDSEDVRDKGIERFHVPVTQICYYRLVSKGQRWNYKFWLAEDGRVAAYSDSE